MKNSNFYKYVGGRIYLYLSAYMGTLCYFNLTTTKAQPNEDHQPPDTIVGKKNHLHLLFICDPLDYP